MNIQEIISSADDLRKAERYADAIGLYQQAWESEKQPFVVRNIIFCYRKLKLFQEAESFLLEAQRLYPNDKYIQSEAGWLIYDAEIKPAKENRDIGKAIYFANKAIAIGENQLLAVRTSITIAQIAKSLANPNWAKIAEWLEKISSDDLSPEKNGKTYMSEREWWYVNYSRSLFEINDYIRSREVALSGLKQFPDEIHLLRTAGLAAYKSGDLSLGEIEIEQLLNHREKGWYVYSDLAEIKADAGKLEESLGLFCEAFLESNNDSFKLKAFVSFAAVALQLNRLEDAAAHIELAKLIRSKEGWNVPTELLNMELAIKAAFSKQHIDYPTFPTCITTLSNHCKSMWEKESLQNLERHVGYIDRFDKSKNYAFITPTQGGDDVYVQRRDIPQACQFNGAMVEYSTERSYDPKRNRESQRAIRVLCSKSSSS